MPESHESGKAYIRLPAPTARGEKAPLPDGKQRSKSIPTTINRILRMNHKPTGQNHFGTSTLSIRRCVITVSTIQLPPSDETISQYAPQT